MATVGAQQMLAGVTLWIGTWYQVGHEASRLSPDEKGGYMKVFKISLRWDVRSGKVHKASQLILSFYH